MDPEQKQLELAIANVDDVVSSLQCNRQTRSVVEKSWLLIVERAREDRKVVKQ